MYSTLINWAVVLGVALLLTHRYNPNLLPRLLRRFQPSTPIQPPPQQPKKKKREKSTSTPVNEAPISKKRKIVSAPVEDSVQVTTTKGNKTSIPRDEDGDMGDREFAQQLAKAQMGTKLERSAGPVKETRTVKTAKAFESPTLSADTSSTGGRDADDEVSPVGSPPSGPVTAVAPTSRAGDVSEMLEAPAPKPTTLKITDIPDAKPKPIPKPKEQPLTQKQRQRQAQNEERKKAMAEADKLQNRLKEQQIRTARMAEGTSNQTKANSFTPTQKAWKATPQPAEPAQPAQPAPLLDTFEPETPRPVSNTNGHTTRPSLSREARWADEVNQEAEDERERELIQEAQWQEVTTKKSQKRNKKETDTSSEASAGQKPNGTGTGVNGSRTGLVNRFSSMEKLGGSDDWEA